MTTSEFCFSERLDLGHGLKAVKAWPGRGPLVLIEVVDAHGEQHNARLDINKLVFIDELPYEPCGCNVHSLVNALVQAQVDEEGTL